MLHESFLLPCVSESSSSDVLESTEVKVPVSRCLESSMFDEFSVASLDDHVTCSTSPAIVSRSVQCETIDSFHTPRLDAETPEFIPSHTDIPVFTTSTAIVLAQPTVSSMTDEYVLELCHVNPSAHAAAPIPHLAHVRTSEVVDPQDRSPDSDSNVIEQRSFVDSTESCSDVIGDIKLPEHVNVLFCQTVESSDLPLDTIKGLKQLMYDHKDTFATSSADLGFCDILRHDIDTGDARPIKQSPRRPPLAAKDAEDEILDDMLRTGMIEPSTSSWVSPVCLVKKKDGTFRFCINYRRVNAVSKTDAYPLPDIHDALDHLRGAKYFATFDLLSGYWQLGLTKRAKERSAFCTRRGLFSFYQNAIWTLWSTRFLL